MTPQARQIIREVAAKRGLHPLQIVSKSRTRRVFRARVEVAERLYARGCYSSTRIGALLGQDHTTIVYYLGRAKRKPKPEPPPKWRKPHITFLFHYKPPIPPPPPRAKQKPGGLIPYAGAEAH